MDKNEVVAKVELFSNEVVKQYNPEKIILYGSYARGNQNKDSDIDVAVVVKRIDGDFLENEASLYRIRRNIDVNIEPVLLLEGSDKSGFLESILSYGEVVYQRI